MHEQRLFCIGSFIVRAQVLLVHARLYRYSTEATICAAIIRLRVVSDISARRHPSSSRYFESHGSERIQKLARQKGISYRDSFEAIPREKKKKHRSNLKIRPQADTSEAAIKRSPLDSSLSHRQQICGIRIFFFTGANNIRVAEKCCTLRDVNVTYIMTVPVSLR